MTDRENFITGENSNSSRNNRRDHTDNPPIPMLNI